MGTRVRARFNLGSVVATPGALAFLEERDASGAELLERHATGDWGDLDAGDKKLNDAAVKGGDRILSSYDVGDGKVWVITEWDRSVTTILLPEEY